MERMDNFDTIRPLIDFISSLHRFISSIHQKVDFIESFSSLFSNVIDHSLTPA